MYEFNEKTIQRQLRTKWVGETIHFSPEVDSTNLWIGRLAAQGVQEGTLAVAELQTAGRGRLGRSWSVPKDCAITMSLLLRPKFAPYHAAMMTLLMGLSVAQACREWNLKVGIKWPNDAVVGGKKICGILTEMRLAGSEIDYVVIGTGINVNVRSFPEELAQTATSFVLEKGCICDRAEILGAVLRAFEKNYEKFLETLDLTLLKEDYEELLVNKDREVRVLDPLGAYTGIARGINVQGELLVELPDGSVREVNAGEVSVRGIYGYV